MGVNPWPQAGASNAAGGVAPVDKNPLVSYPTSTNIPDTAANFADVFAQIMEQILALIVDIPAMILEVLGMFLDMLCTMFTGNATSGSTPQSFTSGTQSAMDSICGMMSGNLVGGTTGSSMIAGAQGAIGSGSNVLTGDPTAITSGQGLMDGGTNLMNLLCGLCSGSMLAERIPELSQEARDRLGIPGKVGTVAPIVNGASLVAGLQGWIGVGSNHLTNDPAAITSGQGLAAAAQTHLGVLHKLFGGLDANPTASDVLTQSTQYQADAAAIAGNPEGMGTGSPAVVGGASSIPILAPVHNDLQDFKDKLHAALTGDTTTGHSAADVANAAAQLAATQANTLAIAQDNAQAIAIQALNNPLYHAGDPSATGVFNYTTITGSTATTFSVTQANTAIGFINIQTAAPQRSVAIEAAVVGTVTGVYLNIYQLDTATATLASPVWQSPNIVSFLGASLAKIATTIGTALQAPQAQWYAVELQVIGSGSVTLVGMPGHWAAADTSLCPQALAATRAVVGTPSLPPAVSSIHPIVYSNNIPLFSLSASAAQAAYAPLVYFWDLAGSYNVSGIPSWVGVADVIAVGGGSSGASGTGTGSVAGGDSSAMIGSATLTAAGAAAVSGNSGSPVGASPGLFSYNGDDYQGGTAAPVGDAGLAPGGGSGGAIGLFHKGNGGAAGAWAGHSYAMAGISAITANVGVGGGNAADGAVWVILRQQVGGVVPAPASLPGAGRLSATVDARSRAATLAGSGALSSISYPKYTLAAALPGHGALSATAIPTIAFIQGANDDAGAGDSVIIPTHVPGDLIVIFAFAESSVSGSFPVVPAAGGTVPPWVAIDSPAASNQCAMRTVQYLATSNNHTSGVWTHATDMIAVVLSGAYATAPIGGHGVNNGSNTALASAPSITMVNTDGTSQLLYFFGHRNVGAVTWAAAPTGTTQLVTGANACLDTANFTTSDGGVTQAVTGAGQGGYFGATIEIRSH